MTNTELEKQLKRMAVILAEQQDLIAILIKESVFTQAAALALLNVQPKSKRPKVMPLYAAHFYEIEERLKSKFREQKLETFLRIFSAGTPPTDGTSGAPLN